MAERLSQRPLFNVDVAFGDLPEPEPEVVDRLLHGERDTTYHTDFYRGRRMTWRGSEGRMLKLTWDRVRPVQGNIFYPEKLAAFAELVRMGDAEFGAPPAWLTHIDLNDVAETQHAARTRANDLQYDSLTRPYTTDDDELDEWLASEDGQAFAGKAYKMPKPKNAMERRAMKAVKTKQGDVGKVVGQLRDGNHRAFGAQAAGEPYVMVYVTPDQENGLDPRELE